MLADSNRRAHLAAVAELLAAFAGFGIDLDDPGIERAFDDARRTVLRGDRVRDGVIGDAPAGRGVGNALVGHLWIETPALLAGRRIQRHDDVLGCTHIEGVADLERRILGAVGILGVLHRHVAGVNIPDAGQRTDIVAIDLLQRRIASRAIAAAIGRPVGAGLYRRRIV